MAYRIELADEADEHMAGLSAGERSMLVAAIEQQLVHQPALETRNRKPMRPNPIAPWELRVAHLRVYYEVSDDPAPVVTVRAIGIKVRHRVRIGDEWWETERPEKGDEDPGDEASDG